MQTDNRRSRFQSVVLRKGCPTVPTLFGAAHGTETRSLPGCLDRQGGWPAGVIFLRGEKYSFPRPIAPKNARKHFLQRSEGSRADTHYYRRQRLAAACCCHEPKVCAPNSTTTKQHPGRDCRLWDPFCLRQDWTGRHSTARHGTARHGTAQHSTAQHSTVVSDDAADPYYGATLRSNKRNEK